MEAAMQLVLSELHHSACPQGLPGLQREQIELFGIYYSILSASGHEYNSQVCCVSPPSCTKMVAVVVVKIQVVSEQDS